MKTLAEVEQALRKVPEPQRLLHTNAAALALFIARVEKLLQLELTGTGGGNRAFDPDDAMAHALGVANSENVRGLVHVREAYNVITASPEYKAAKALIEPLLKARAAHLAKAAELMKKRTAELKVARQQLRSAVASQVAAADSPEVAAAKQALQDVETTIKAEGLPIS